MPAQPDSIIAPARAMRFPDVRMPHHHVHADESATELLSGLELIA